MRFFFNFAQLALVPLLLAQIGSAETATNFTSRIDAGFESNRGQTDTRVKFLSRQAGYTLFLTSDEAVLAPRQDAGIKVSYLRLKWDGANKQTSVAGMDASPAKSNYLLGNDPKQWLKQVSRYAKVRYSNLYRGVDLVYYVTEGRLEYDLILAPGIDATSVRLRIQGGSGIRLDPEGNLNLAIGQEKIQFRRPAAYQSDANGVRSVVEVGYVLGAGNEIRFEVGSHDASRPVVIDPQVTYSSYLGGTGNDNIRKIAIDPSGNVYVVGWSTSLDFPLAAPLPNRTPGTFSAVVAKLKPTAAGAASLVYSTYIGGSSVTVGRAIAVDALGQVYLTGDTNSPNFPITSGAYQQSCKAEAGSCSTDAFVAKLDAAGSNILYSTYLGGAGTDYSFALAIDPAGRMYVAGNTDSADLPAASGAFQTGFAGGPAKFGDAFVAEIDPANGRAGDLLYLTYLGGSSSEQAWSIAVDGIGGIVVSGQTSSPNFPVTSTGLQTTYSGGNTDAFVARLFPSRQGADDLTYSTYLGGGADDLAESVAVDSANFIYVTGHTMSSTFPVTSQTAYQSGFKAGPPRHSCGDGICADAFITKLDAALSGKASLLYSSFLGGDGFDLGHAIAVDSTGFVYIAGETGSTNFPTVDPIQSVCSGGCPPAGFTSLTDVILTKFDLTKPGGAGLLFSTYFGGHDVDTAWGLAVDSAGNAYVAGQVFSLDFPTLSPFQSICHNCTSFVHSPNSGDGFVLKVCTAGCAMADMQAVTTTNNSKRLLVIGLIVFAVLAAFWILK